MKLPHLNRNFIEDVLKAQARWKYLALSGPSDWRVCPWYDPFIDKRLYEHWKALPSQYERRHSFIIYEIQCAPDAAYVKYLFRPRHITSNKNGFFTQTRHLSKTKRKKTKQKRKINHAKCRKINKDLTVTTKFIDRKIGWQLMKEKFWLVNR